MRHAINATSAATGIEMIDEPERTLRANDIEAVLWRSVVATIPYDPAIVRAIESGLLTTRLPALLARALRHVVPSLTTVLAR